MDPKKGKTGDEVYVIYHNPHTPSVANVRQAEIVPHPKNPNAVALFLNESFHLIEEDDALFSSEKDAEQAFKELYDDY
ncbi:transcriptional regulator [Sporosarcina globispora]|uniref:Transcriptional regulator n=1 Tax=Sporosarcina globispora TaxID=1459 RepID=A0A0M0GF48_SPOGL|nr:transcriptional regulator SplA domain-containing protein [Sporosarcina globispora]KON88464.1 transcriptional regulator [Sporosarcina globispora]